jgi:predicted MPP superfamily phosphohydrolase
MILVPLILIIIYVFYTKSNVVINKYVVEDDSVDLKIVFFSDLHYKFGNGEKYLKKVLRKINSLDVDLVIFGGDLLGDHYTSKDKDSIIDFLKNIDSRYGKYSIYGNHDINDENDETIVSELLQAGGFKTLINQSEDIIINNKTIRLIGLNNVTYNLYDLECINIKGSDFSILCFHEGDLYDEVKQFGCNLHLSGHSHGGQIYIPYLVDLITPEYGKKYSKGKHDSLISSSGLGMSRLPIRLFARPSIEYIRTKK